MDRLYFKSIWIRNPDGHIVDEDLSSLSQNLPLPPWLERQRETNKGTRSQLETIKE